MKRIMTLLSVAAALAVMAVPVLAQSTECNDENKGAWYKTFYDNFRGTAEQQKTAVEAANKYISACPADPNDKQREYMQKFVDKFKAVQNKADAVNKFQEAITRKNYADQLTYGKQVLQNDPENADVTVVLGVVGLADPKLLNESAQFARKGIDLINAGKSTKVYTRDQALAYLNWTVGKTKIASAPAEAIGDLLKAAKIESDVKKNPQLYLDLAAAYESGPREKLSSEYKASLNPDQTETAQSKVILENLNRVIDNQIDAMARAAALAPDANSKQAVITELTALYKYRNKTATDANVNELVAGVLAKPIPDVPTPVTSLPGPAPASTPAGNTGTNGSTPATSNTATNAAGNKPAGSSTGAPAAGSKAGTATGTTTPASSAKPTPTPGKKPPVRHHRRG